MNEGSLNQTDFEECIDNTRLKMEGQTNVEPANVETSPATVSTVPNPTTVPRPAPRVVFIQSSNVKASDFTQASTGQSQIVVVPRNVSSMVQVGVSNTNASTSMPNFTKPIILPASSSLQMTNIAKPQLMIQAKSKNPSIAGLLPLSVSTANGNKQFYIGNQLVTHLPVGLLPAPSNQKFVIKPMLNPGLAKSNLLTTVDGSKVILPSAHITASNTHNAYANQPVSTVVINKPSLLTKSSQIQKFQTVKPAEKSLGLVYNTVKVPPLDTINGSSDGFVNSVNAPLVTTHIMAQSTKSPVSLIKNKEYTLSIPEENSDTKWDEPSDKSNPNRRFDLERSQTPDTEDKPIEDTYSMNKIAILKKTRSFNETINAKNMRITRLTVSDSGDLTTLAKTAVAVSQQASQTGIVLTKLDGADAKIDTARKDIGTHRRKSQNTILRNDEFEFTYTATSASDEESKASTSNESIGSCSNNNVLRPTLESIRSNPELSILKVSETEATTKPFNHTEEIHDTKSIKTEPLDHVIKTESIELDVTPEPLKPIENFDPIKALKWHENGVGRLSGSKFSFQVNEFGFLQILLPKRRGPEPGKKSGSSKKSKNKQVDEMAIVKCEQCACHGCRADFLNARFCSSECMEDFNRDVARNIKEVPRRGLVVRKTKELVQSSFGKKDGAESSRSTPVPSDDENPDDRLSYPWLCPKKGFQWSKYLHHVNGKAAPVKLFKEPYPYDRNGFRVGMKMEGIDPQHPAYFCVLTVYEVSGYRIRLHFDGYSEEYDFWVNADSNDIFPAGWCEKYNHKLQPPKGLASSANFSWSSYLQEQRATVAPKHLFAAHRNKNSLCPTGFRLGMKLEAVDRKNSSLICVATVTDVIDNRFLVHFDSWDDIYDYWADPTSPYIHPVGWCEQKGLSLTPPNNYVDPNDFVWEDFLKETKSTPVPSRAFKQRTPNGFKRGMRLEVVDKRVPRFVRVATVDVVRDHQIHIQFDGWPEKYGYWLDDDSSDIHPVGWCSKSGHSLQPPMTPDDVCNSPCETPGCQGWGNIKGPMYDTHNVVEECPYADENLDRELQKDRLVEELEYPKPKEAVPLSKQPKRQPADSTTCSSANNSIVRESVNESSIARGIRKKRSNSFESDDEWSLTKKKARKRQPYVNSHGGSDASNEDNSVLDFNDLTKTAGAEKANNAPWYFERNRASPALSAASSNNDLASNQSSQKLPVNLSMVPQSHTTETRVNFFTNEQNRPPHMYGITPPSHPMETPIESHAVSDPSQLTPLQWNKHSQKLFGHVKDICTKYKTKPNRWSVHEVNDFIAAIPSCKEYRQLFTTHEIDGEALLMLTKHDMMNLLGFKLGPAISLYNSIVLLRQSLLSLS